MTVWTMEIPPMDHGGSMPMPWDPQDPEQCPEGMDRRPNCFPRRSDYREPGDYFRDWKERSTRSIITGIPPWHQASCENVVALRTEGSREESLMQADARARRDDRLRQQ